jgi:hypothetical protein
MTVRKDGEACLAQKSYGHGIGASDISILEFGFMHVMDVNGDGQLDVISGKRYVGHNRTDIGEKEPMGLYWYEFRKAAGRGPNTVEWFRHIVDDGGRMGGGLQIVVQDMDGDGDTDIVSGGKAGLFLAENLTKQPK